MCQKLTNNPKWLILSTYITDLCTNITCENRTYVRNSQNLKITVIFHHALCIHIIDHFNPLVRITTQLLIPILLCALILYMSAETYRFFCFETFYGFFYLSSEFLPEICQEDVAQKYFLYFLVFEIFDLGFELKLSASLQ